MIYDLRFSIDRPIGRFCGALKFGGLALVLSTLNFQFSTLHAFEGRITAMLTRGGETQTVFYSVGTNRIRIERGETDWPHAKNIVDRDSGATTILFPHNRSFVRLKNTVQADRSVANPPGVPAPPSVPDGAPAFPSPPTARPIIGPTNLPGTPAPPAMPRLLPGVGPQAGPGSGALPMPAMPMMPPMPMERADLKATDQTTNLFGLPCTRYELKQRGEVVEIWATDKLIPFQPYLQNQPQKNFFRCSPSGKFKTARSECASR